MKSVVGLLEIANFDSGNFRHAAYGVPCPRTVASSVPGQPQDREFRARHLRLGVVKIDPAIALLEPRLFYRASSERRPSPFCASSTLTSSRARSSCMRERSRIFSAFFHCS